MLYGNLAPISGRADSRGFVPYKEKRTLPGADADVSWFDCVAALGSEEPISASGFGNIDPIPFRLAQALLACMCHVVPNGVCLSLRTD